MFSPCTTAFTLALATSIVSAAIFPKNSGVQMLDPKGFKISMKSNQTSMVAFVAPWCGHCQKMVPEYSKAAQSLHPLIPAYAVDCDDDKNKRLCAEQGVQGFPTVKLFPRGAQMAPLLYDLPERTAKDFFQWATRRVPNHVIKLYRYEKILQWIEKEVESHRVLLLTKKEKVPLLWKVLGNKFKGRLTLGSHLDGQGITSVQMGYEAGGEKESKILVYPAGYTTAFRYEGVYKLESLSQFFDSVLDGTADLSTIIEKDAMDELAADKKGLDVEQQQHFEGFTVPIDSQDGNTDDHHGEHGHPGKSDSAPLAGITASIMDAGHEPTAVPQENGEDSVPSGKGRDTVDVDGEVDLEASAVWEKMVTDTEQVVSVWSTSHTSTEKIRLDDEL